MPNRKRRCRCCKTYRPVEDGKVINKAFFCDLNCATTYAMDKGLKASAKKERAKHKQAKERVKSYRTKMAEMQTIFNKLRRLQELKWFKDRGQEPTCISCGKPLGNDQWCNGHFKTVGARPDLRFDPINSYLQHNHRCNKMLSGDIDGYKEGLKRRFGEEEANRIIDYCNTEQPTIKWSDDEIAHIKQLWRKEIRELEVKVLSRG